MKKKSRQYIEFSKETAAGIMGMTLFVSSVVPDFLDKRFDGMKEMSKEELGVIRRCFELAGIVATYALDRVYKGNNKELQKDAFVVTDVLKFMLNDYAGETEEAEVGKA